jgi:hypothetical protein
LTKAGQAVFIDRILSSHRWHATSLTYSRRWDSVREASEVRVSNLGPITRMFSFFWELPIQAITYLGGEILSGNFLKKSKK